MAAFLNCDGLNEIKQEIGKLLPVWHERYNCQGINAITIPDEAEIFFILKRFIKTTIDFHLFYRWIGLSSDWSIEPPFRGLKPMDFWNEFYSKGKALAVFQKLLRDYKVTVILFNIKL